MTLVKILIAEDEVLIARKIEATLHKLGYATAAIAFDGASAIQKVAETQPDLVLMDILMPGELSGIEAAQQIQAQYQTPVVYLTAYGDVETLKRANITEPFGYILKPFQPQDLNTTIQVALTRYRVEQQKLTTLCHSIGLSLPHEVNTPLSGILGVVNLVINYYDSFSATEVLEMLHCIRTSAVRLERLHHNFLLYSKLALLNDPAQVEIFKQGYTFSIEQLMQNLVQSKAKEYDRLEDIKTDLQEVSVQISEIYLQKIGEELLDNAFKFSQIGSSVQLQTSHDKQQFTLSVRDRGRGMTAEQITSLNAFVQFDRLRHEQQGLGLGLALVKHLVELHDGQLVITSKVGEGTTVTVHLPVMKDEDVQLQVRN